jgi:hypothetical protein
VLTCLMWSRESTPRKLGLDDLLVDIVHRSRSVNDIEGLSQMMMYVRDWEREKMMLQAASGDSCYS